MHCPLKGNTMNLNRLGSGRKFINQIAGQGNAKNMGWTQQQQQKILDTQKNVHNPSSRKNAEK